MSSRLLIATPLAALFLSGCLTNMNQNPISPDPGFGETVKYNAAVQIIDPDPVYAAQDAQPGDRGDKGAAAVKRYRNDAVKAPEKQTTTSGPG